MGKVTAIGSRQKDILENHRSIDEGGVGVRSPSAHACHRTESREPPSAYKREGEATARDIDRTNIIKYSYSILPISTVSDHSSDDRTIQTSLQLLNGWEDISSHPLRTLDSIGSFHCQSDRAKKKASRASLSSLSDFKSGTS